MNEISQKLSLKQSQNLVMTPQLQQAIKLLQLNNLEIAEFIEEEIAQNPLLEKEELKSKNGPNKRKTKTAKTKPQMKILMRDLPWPTLAKAAAHRLKNWIMRLKIQCPNLRHCVTI